MRHRIVAGSLGLVATLGLAACSSSSAATPAAATATPSHHHAKHPGVSGVITAITSSSLTLRTAGGSSRTLTLGSTTKVRDAGSSVTVGTLHAGERVRVRFVTGSTTSAAAVNVLHPKASPSASASS
ncbi:MAG: hypothetical protein ACYCXA_14460 [Actinomycetes bacterium]